MEFISITDRSETTMLDEAKAAGKRPEPKVKRSRKASTPRKRS
jgi:hypothetical protein